MLGIEMTMRASTAVSRIERRMAAWRWLSVALGAKGIDGLQPPFERCLDSGRASARCLLDALLGVGDGEFEFVDEPFGAGIVGRQAEHVPGMREGFLQAALLAAGLGQRQDGCDVVGCF